MKVNKITRNVSTHSEELSFPKYVARIIKLYKIVQKFFTVLTKKEENAIQ